MKKIFLSNLILVIGLNVLIKPFYIFGIDRSVQNEVGASEYGLYFALFNFAYLFQIFNDFGIQNFNHSVFSKYPWLIPKYLPKILGAKVLLAGIFLTFCLISAVIAGFRIDLWPLLLVIILNQILASFLLYLRTTLSATGHYTGDSIISVADKLLMIILVGSLLWFIEGFKFTILNFVWCQTLSFVLSIVTALAFLKLYAGIPTFKMQFDRIFSIAFFKQSIPYALVLFLMTLYTRMDGVMLERMLPDGKEQAGIYAASYRLLDALGMVGLLFAGLLLPMFAKLIRHRDSVEEITRTARNSLLTFSITIIAMSFTYSQPIIFALYHDATEYWVSVFQVLFPSFMGIALGYIYGTLLTANESINAMNKIFTAGVLLNLVLNLIFITKWQAWGAATATLITQVLTSLALMILAHRHLKLKADLQGWSILLLFALIVFIFCQWTHSLEHPLLVSLSLVSFFAFVLAWVLGLVRLRQWFILVQATPDR